MARMNAAFAEQVQNELATSGFDMLIEPSIRGITPDFLVSLTNGRKVLLEAKGWAPTNENVDRAVQQTRYFREALGISDSYVVLPTLPEGSTEHSEVVGIGNLVALLQHLGDLDPSTDPPTVENSSPMLFCAMPFEESFDDVFLVAMRGAAEENGLTARRVDHEEYIGDIVDFILSLIEESGVVVADISQSNPNVMYEAGYATALGKPVVPICSTPIRDLPFNIAQRNTIEYQIGRVAHLTSKLARRVAAAIKSS